ncbi:MAG: MerR family transcriptional regulator [Candidatus Marinimicrobia bacterium]|nr:MerR family transcriptional regulator [Candidatus Neomarinimicrobiota bacterium]
MNTYLIGDLAAKTRLPIDTLNYYLRIDLIKEIGRSERSGYRYFNDDTVVELKKIIKLRLKHIPIREIKQRIKDGIF